MGVAKTIARNAFFNSIYSNVDWVANFIVSIILARGLGTEGYGLYSYLLWFLGTAELVVNLGLGDMLQRFISEALGRNDMHETKSLVKLALSLRASFAAAACTLILVLAGFWAQTLTNASDRGLFILIAFTLMPNVLTNVLISAFAGFQKYEYRAYIILCMSPLRVVLVLILTVLHFGVRDILLVNLAIWILSAFSGFFFLNRLIPLQDVFSASPLGNVLRKRALKYAVSRAGIYGINYFASGSVAAFFIGLYLSTEQVGFYGIATRLTSTAMTLIPSVLGAVLVPAIAEQFGKGDMNRIRTIFRFSTRYILMLALPVAAAGIALGKPVLELLYGTEYSAVLAPMQVMFIPAALSVVADGVSAVILGIDKPVFLIKVGAGLAVINLSLLVLLTPVYGVVGAAIAGSVPQILLVVLCAGYASKQIGVSWPFADSAKAVTACVLMAVALFCLQSYVKGVFSLVLGIPLALVLYVVVLLILGAIQRDDIRIMKGVQNSLPLALRKISSTILFWVEKAVQVRLTRRGPH